MHVFTDSFAVTHPLSFSTARKAVFYRRVSNAQWGTLSKRWLKGVQPFVRKRSNFSQCQPQVHQGGNDLSVDYSFFHDGHKEELDASGFTGINSIVPPILTRFLGFQSVVAGMPIGALFKALLYSQTLLIYGLASAAVFIPPGTRS